jgi:hypothetical protein
MQTINIFPKTLRFFTISFDQVNDVYVKIYETPQLTMFYFFYQNQSNIHINFARVLWLHFQFHRTHYHEIPLGIATAASLIQQSSWIQHIFRC